MSLRDQLGGRLFWKYTAYFAVVVSIALLSSGIGELYLRWQDEERAIGDLQREKAVAAATIIENYIMGIERALYGRTPLSDGHDRAERADLLLTLVRLLRQVPAISDVRLLDDAGREYLYVSRLYPNAIGSSADYSRDTGFLAARTGRVYFWDIRFYRGTEPYMTMAVQQRALRDWIIMADVNLKFMWDVVSRMSFGKSGQTYVVDARGQLIAHADMMQVLSRTDMSVLPQVAFALPGAVRDSTRMDVPRARDLRGKHVVAAHAAIRSLGWVVFSEQEAGEARTRLTAVSRRTLWFLLFGFGLAIVSSLVLMRKIIAPVRALRLGAERLADGRLAHRIDVRTGDELQALAESFNRMAGQLEASYADLENKVALRTRELEHANQAKSRFLAVASHELNQPMHALGLFAAALRERATSPEIASVASRIEQSVDALRALLDALLDISKLDAGDKVVPQFSVFEIGPMLERLRGEFAADARARGLQLRVRIPRAAAVSSDPVLLERILRNLVSNALRYTHCGGVLVGCRRRGARISVEVFDTGIGIGAGETERIFEEFYQVRGGERDGRKAMGLGLGLAIVKRLGHLLGHEIRVASRLGRGSVFRVDVPMGDRACALRREPNGGSAPDAAHRLAAMLIVVIDDELDAREATRLLLEKWDCKVVSASSADEAARALAVLARAPDGIVADYRLDGGQTGLEAIRRLRTQYDRDIPAILVTGDHRPEIAAEAGSRGVVLLHKPVSPARLLAVLAEVIAPTGTV